MPRRPPPPTHRTAPAIAGPRGSARPARAACRPPRPRRATATCSRNRTRGSTSGSPQDGEVEPGEPAVLRRHRTDPPYRGLALQDLLEPVGDRRHRAVAYAEHPSARRPTRELRADPVRDEGERGVDPAEPAGQAE